MAQTALCDGWFVDGDPSTDVFIDTSVGVSGSSSIKFPSGGADVSLYSNWAPTESYDGSEGVAAQTVSYFVAKADSIVSTDRVRLRLELTTDFITLSTWTIYDAALTSTANWRQYGKILQWVTAGKWFRMRIDRPEGRAFNLWIDRAYFDAIAGHNIGSGTAPLYPFAATWTKIQGPASGSGSLGSTTTGTFSPDSPGLWSVGGHVLLGDSALEAGDMFGVRLKVASTHGGTFYRYGSTTTIHAAFDALSNPVPLTVSCEACPLDIGDTVELEGIQYTNIGTLKDYFAARIFAARISGE